MQPADDFLKNNVDLIYIPARLKCRLRQFRQLAVFKSAGRRDSLASEPGVLEDRECVAQIIANLIGRLAHAKAPVLNEGRGALGIRPSGTGVDGPGMAHHLGVERHPRTGNGSLPSPHVLKALHFQAQ